MTLAELSVLDPRELDARVHTLVMGYEGVPANGPPWYRDHRSSSLMLAVLDRLLDLGWWVEIQLPGGKRSDGDKIEVSLYSDFWEQEEPVVCVTADTLPRACAIAALLAVEDKR